MLHINTTPISLSKRLAVIYGKLPSKDGSDSVFDKSFVDNVAFMVDYWPGDRLTRYPSLPGGKHIRVYNWRGGDEATLKGNGDIFGLNIDLQSFMKPTPRRTNQNQSLYVWDEYKLDCVAEAVFGALARTVTTFKGQHLFVDFEFNHISKTNYLIVLQQLKEVARSLKVAGVEKIYFQPGFSFTPNDLALLLANSDYDGLLYQRLFVDRTIDMLPAEQKAYNILYQTNFLCPQKKVILQILLPPLTGINRTTIIQYYKKWALQHQLNSNQLFVFAERDINGNETEINFTQLI